MDGEDEESTEAQQVKVKAGPRTPTAKEVAEHEASGHVQYRSWCRHCVAARGIGQYHHARDQSDEANAIPVVCCDYGYMSDEISTEEVYPMLVVKDRKTKGYAASCVLQRRACILTQ